MTLKLKSIKILLFSRRIERSRFSLKLELFQQLNTETDTLMYSYSTVKRIVRVSYICTVQYITVIYKALYLHSTVQKKYITCSNILSGCRRLGPIYSYIAQTLVKMYCIAYQQYCIHIMIIRHYILYEYTHTRSYLRSS